MINDRKIDQAFSDLRGTCGGVREDYFGLLYLEEEHDVPREKSVNQVAFGGNDYGVDGFHFDKARRNLYIFQFKYTTSHAQFKGSLQRLIDDGMQQIFVSPNKDDKKNQILLQLRSCLVDNRALIDQICFRFVFTGDPEEAERSKVLEKLREDLENKRYGVLEESRAIQMLKLTQVFLLTDGNISRVSEMRRVFEDDRVYDHVFRQSRLKADSRLILLCYKVQYRLRKIANEIEQKGQNKYSFIHRSRYLLWALICQGLLNHDELEELAEDYGRSLAVPAEFTDLLSRIATTRVRLLLAALWMTGNIETRLRKGISVFSGRIGGGDIVCQSSLERKRFLPDFFIFFCSSRISVNWRTALESVGQPA